MDTGHIQKLMMYMIRGSSSRLLERTTSLGQESKYQIGKVHELDHKMNYSYLGCCLDLTMLLTAIVDIGTMN